ncbi:uncharacterized protein V6R79_011091 [Siganus canaliculatus]
MEKKSKASVTSDESQSPSNSATDSSSGPESKTELKPERKVQRCTVQTTSSECEASTSSAADSSSGSESESSQRFRAFVTVLTVKVWNKLIMDESYNLVEWLELTRTLQQGVMDGLTVNKDFCPEAKSIKKLCKAAIKQVQQQLGTKSQRDALIVRKDPAVFAVIVKAIRTQVRDYSEKQANSRQQEETQTGPRRWWKRLVKRRFAPQPNAGLSQQQAEEPQSRPRRWWNRLVKRIGPKFTCLVTAVVIGIIAVPLVVLSAPALVAIVSVVGVIMAFHAALACFS